jgi:hypothetical protein
MTTKNKISAKSGLDFVRGTNHSILKKTKTQWQRWANKKAKKIGYGFEAFVFIPALYITGGKIYVRISFGKK